MKIRQKVQNMYVQNFNFPQYCRATVEQNKVDVLSFDKYFEPIVFNVPWIGGVG